MSTLQRPLTACRDKERTKLAMKSMWKGNMGFGMVNFPIKLYKGTDEKASGVSLCNTHRECGTAVKEPKYCPKCEKMLVQEDLQKAYPEDTKKTKCIPITEADLAALPLPSAHNIQIEGFVEGLTDRRYPDTVYFVEPEELGDRAFALFDMALRQKGVLGVAKVTTGSKEHLCLIGPTGDGLLYVQTIHWASELRDSAELRRPTVKVSAVELRMAGMLIDTLPKNIDLASYQNEYGAALKKLVADKKAGIEITVAEPVPVKEVDLIEQLMASLKAAQAPVA
jgi:DNA end-binding protein Ku